MKFSRTSVAAAALVLAAVLPAVAAPISLGQKLAPFALKQAGGQIVDLAALGGRKAYVLAFIAARCPVSTAYDARMAAFAKEYESQGVAFVGINSSSVETPAEIAEHARQSGFAFPVLLDEGSRKADELGARFTPEVYVFDAEWALRYQGRIDDDPAGSAVPSADLKAAVDALLAGREIRLKQTKAFGCTIKRAATRESTR